MEIETIKGKERNKTKMNDEISCQHENLQVTFVIITMHGLLKKCMRS